MSITRRQFLFQTSGTLVSFILPAYFDKAFNYLEQHGEPLIEIPAQPTIEMLAVDHCSNGEFQLNFGDPWEGPPDVTLREYIDSYYADLDEYLDEHELTAADIDLDGAVDPEWVMDTWAYSSSPNALAYDFLYPLDLGPELQGPDVVGEIQFIDSDALAHDYKGAHAVSELTLSLLQDRLNQLKTGVAIRII